MADLNKTQLKRLQTVRANLNRGLDFLKKYEVHIAVAERDKDLQYSPRGDHYVITNKEITHGDKAEFPERIHLSNKYIGSDIAGLHEALRLIDEFLANPSCKIIIRNEDELE